MYPFRVFGTILAQIFQPPTGHPGRLSSPCIPMNWLITWEVLIGRRCPGSFFILVIEVIRKGGAFRFLEGTITYPKFKGSCEDDFLLFPGAMLVSGRVVDSIQDSRGLAVWLKDDEHNKCWAHGEPPGGSQNPTKSRS